MSFKKVNEVEKNKIEIEFSIEKDAFDAQTAKVFRKKAAKMTIPGFRKGKACLLYTSRNCYNLYPRFDVIEVVVNNNDLKVESVNHIDNAFDINARVIR